MNTDLSLITQWSRSKPQKNGALNYNAAETKNALTTCTLLEQNGHWKKSCLTTVSVIEGRLQINLLVRSFGRMTMAEENRNPCRKSVSSSVYPPQILHWFVWDSTRASVLIGRRITLYETSEQILVTFTIRAQWCLGVVDYHRNRGNSWHNDGVITYQAEWLFHTVSCTKCVGNILRLLRLIQF